MESIAHATRCHHCPCRLVLHRVIGQVGISSSAQLQHRRGGVPDDIGPVTFANYHERTLHRSRPGDTLGGRTSRKAAPRNRQEPEKQPNRNGKPNKQHPQGLEPGTPTGSGGIVANYASGTGEVYRKPSIFNGYTS